MSLVYDLLKSRAEHEDVSSAPSSERTTTWSDTPLYLRNTPQLKGSFQRASAVGTLKTLPPLTSPPIPWKSNIPKQDEGSGYIPPSRDFGGEPGLLDRALDAAKHTGKFLVGVALGVAIAEVPGGPLLTYPLNTGDRDIELGRGFGETAVGMLEMAEAAPPAVAGIAGAPESFGLSLVLDVPEAIAMANTAGGIMTLNRALNMSTGGNAGSSSSSPSGKPQPKTLEEAEKISADNRRLAAKDKELLKRYQEERIAVDNSGYGFQDFSGDLRDPALGPNDVNIGELRGSRAADEAAANEIAGYADTPPGYTWHHHEDLGRMQLVRKTAHRVGHEGGVAIWKRIFGPCDY